MPRRTPPLPPLTDAEANGLADLYRRHAARLGRMLRRRFGAADAEDLVQETYLRMAARPQPEDIRHPAALLAEIARNAGRDEARRVRVRGGAAVVALNEMGAWEAPSVRGDQDPTVLLKQLVLTMPEPWRDVFVLSRFVGLTYHEIAEHYGISVKTVEWRMGKALAWCADQIGSAR